MGLRQRRHRKKKLSRLLKMMVVVPFIVVASLAWDQHTKTSAFIWETSSIVDDLAGEMERLVSEDHTEGRYEEWLAAWSGSAFRTAKLYDALWQIGSYSKKADQIHIELGGLIMDLHRQYSDSAELIQSALERGVPKTGKMPVEAVKSSPIFLGKEKVALEALAFLRKYQKFYKNDLENLAPMLLVYEKSKKNEMKSEHQEFPLPVDAVPPPPIISEPEVYETADTAKVIPNKQVDSLPLLDGDMLVVADFNTGVAPNNIGGAYGAWDKDPQDDTQGCTLDHEAGSDALGDPYGYALKIQYDVDSAQPAYNGFWMKLGEDSAMNYRDFHYLQFDIRGDDKAGFTPEVKVELKDSAMQPSPYVVYGVNERWQRVKISLDVFKQLKSKDDLREFVLVFEDTHSRPETGAVYLDNVSFSKT